MQNLHKYFWLSHIGSKNLYSPFLCLFSSVPSASHTNTSTLTSNPSITNFLIETLAFSEPLAISISNRFPPTKTLENPHSVVQFLKQHGFSDTHIRSTIQLKPNVLFSNVDKTLKPKLQFFQNLGLTGPDLSKFISTHSHVLHDSLENTVIPFVDIIKKTLVNDKDNQDLIRVLQSLSWFSNKSVSRLKCNIAFLESCGIVGSQLSMLLKTQRRLFVMPEPALRDLVSRVLDLGFSVDSRMLVYAVFTVCGMSGETFSRKIELFRTFGFSEGECINMFRRAPTLLRTSEGKLKLGMEFFLNDVKLERSALFRWPKCLMNSMGERIIPRYKVLQVVKCKRLLKKVPSLLSVLNLSEEKFLDKYVLRFRDDAEELLVIYKGDAQWNRKSEPLVDYCVCQS